MDELIAVNVVIADRTYRLKLPPKDEGRLRAVSKLINDKVNEFKNLYAGKDMQDYISMVMLWFATEQSNENRDVLSDEATTAHLSEINKSLDKLLE